MSNLVEYEAKHGGLNQSDIQHAIIDDYDVIKKRIKWESLPSNSITEDDILQLKKLEGDNDIIAPEADINAIFQDPEQSQRVAKAFIKLLEIRNEEILQYILTLLSHILQQDPSRGKIFLSLKIPNLEQSFSRVWQRDELSLYIRGKAAICGAYILRLGDGSLNQGYTSLSIWILQELKNGKNDHLLLPLYALKAIITNTYFAKIFSSQSGIERLKEILIDHKDHRQIVYLIVFCFWSLSFQKEYWTHDTLLNGTLLDILVQTVQSRLSPKVVRVILALFENLLNKDNFNEIILLFGLFGTLTQLEGEKLDDDDVKASTKNLLDGLEKDVRILSSYEKYITELQTGKLKWGPVHEESFWKKFSHKFEENEFELIRKLISLLSSDDNETVAVACNDLGEWSRFYPDGKRVVDKLKGKLKIMELLDHNDANVRKYALTSVQKLLINNWEALESSKDDEKKQN